MAISFLGKSLWVKCGTGLALSALLTAVSGCTSSAPQKADNYSGILSSRGIVPPAGSAPVSSARRNGVRSGAPAAVPAPAGAEGDDFAVIPEESVKEAPSAVRADDAAAPAEAAPEVAEAAGLPAAPTNGREVPDFGGKSGKGGTVKGGTSSAGAAVYVVKKGDSLSKIAKAHGVKSAELLAMNPAVKNANQIRIGQKLNVPGNGAVAAVSGGEAGHPAKSGSAREKIPADGVYTVAANDSLWTIARRFGVKRDDLRTWNNLSSDKLRVGQKLALRADAVTGSAKNAPAPKTDAPAPAASPAPSGAVGNVDAPVVAPSPESGAAAGSETEEVNTVPVAATAGDTFESLAATMNCSVSDLERLNPGLDGNNIPVGTLVNTPMPTLE